MLARIEPPIHEPNRRSIVPFAEIIFRRVFDGARTDRSLFNRSGKPCHWNMRESNQTPILKGNQTI